jgi:hypothetical protein
MTQRRPGADRLLTGPRMAGAVLGLSHWCRSDFSRQSAVPTGHGADESIANIGPVGPMLSC